MCELVEVARSRERRGRKSKLSVENQVLLTLTFWREDRTMFHLGKDYGLHEANVSRLVRKIEDILSKSKKFSLPGKRRLLETAALTYTIIDGTEMTIERPPKNNGNVTAEKSSDSR